MGLKNSTDTNTCKGIDTACLQGIIGGAGALIVVLLVTTVLSVITVVVVVKTKGRRKLDLTSSFIIWEIQLLTK